MHLAVNGIRLFLDLRGTATDPALLYLHGGPGMSCHAFMTWQGDRLSQRLFVIGLDQRGVLRSDPLGPGETFTEDTLVDDCEAVRAELGIPQWTILGQSYSGRLALRYACRHPDRVGRLVEHDRYDDLYFHRAEARSAWRELPSFPDDLEARSAAHNKQGMVGLREPVVPLLAQVTMPAP